VFVQIYTAFPHEFPIHHWRNAGSELWFGLLSYDLLNTMQNPLANLTSLKKYHVFVNVTCFGFAIALVGARGLPPFRCLPSIFDTCNHRHCLSGYGRSPFGMCWIRTGGNDEALNSFMVVMFYTPIIIIYLFSLTVMFMAFVRLNKGLRHTIQTRRFIIERERNYVVTCVVVVPAFQSAAVLMHDARRYFLFWTLAVILYGVAWLNDADRAYYWRSSNKVSLTFVFVFMAKSCVSAVVRCVECLGLSPWLCTDYLCFSYSGFMATLRTRIRRT
jgi:hypothetical protein